MVDLHDTLGTIPFADLIVIVIAKAEAQRTNDGSTDLFASKEVSLAQRSRNTNPYILPQN